MAKDQSDFFKEKKPWSEVKDELLACYLKPYFQKVLYTRKPVRYIDCFAGRGDFDDGKPGSPLIALNIARDCIRAGTTGNKDIALTFIENQWSHELEATATECEKARQPSVGFSVVPGRFERATTQVVQNMAGHNVFLYIDPYGVRDLDYDLITSFADKRFGLFSIELLINLNSFGFLRAGCLAMKVRYQGDDALRDDDEFAEEWNPTTKPVEALNRIAGGDYWQAVVDAFKRKEIDGFEAERRFADLYRRKLSEVFDYVLSMPIRLKERQQPKYRMIHATNHVEGCILMADNMMSRTANLAVHMSAYQQASLFGEDVEGEIIDQTYVQDQVRAVTSNLHQFTPVDDVVAKFFAERGVICKSSEVRKVLAQLEKDGIVDVRREPAITTKGIPTTFFTTSRTQKVLVCHYSSSLPRFTR
ncbi:MAG: three-Cys-motif partner protein TcmP [Propionibacteriaceae bacterium]|jgi:three-Cys-motif partner protein|nr:three-Cys-motif partner protein TcmP [Propionibacteriaceae bacterium]